MDLNKAIENVVTSGQVDLAGVSELTPAHDFIFQQGGDFIASFPRAISIGIFLPDAIVDLLPRRNERAVRLNYMHHAYNLINIRLDLASSEIGSHLQKKGYQVFPIAASQQVDEEHICASFSHKLGAHLSGLGWIGKNCMLITPERGPRVRWATVLTDAPLETTGTPMQDACGSCQRCVDACPVKAFTGKAFAPGEPREVRYDAAKCNKYLHLAQHNEQMRVCGLCLYVCPFGTKATGQKKNDS